LALCDGSTRSSRELGKLRWSRETEIAEPPAAADRALALLALRPLSATLGRPVEITIMRSQTVMDSRSLVEDGH